jgi:hypothetical protein
MKKGLLIAASILCLTGVYSQEQEMGISDFGLKDSLTTDSLRSVRALSLNTNVALSDVEVYPNPASSVFHVVAPSDEATVQYVQVYNLLGVLVDEQITTDIQNGFTLFTDHYEDGVYILSITDDKDHDRRRKGTVIVKK